MSGRPTVSSRLFPLPRPERWPRLRALGAALAREVGRDECALGLGLGLVTAGAWPVLGQGALALPGAVLIWLALPARSPFVVRPAPPPRTRE